MITRRNLMKSTAAGAALFAMPNIGRTQQGKILKIIPFADLAVLDPVWTTSWSTQVHGQAVFDLLYGVDENFVAKPQMVAGHVISDDQKTWTLTLRDGLKFHDGEPVLARDAVASIKRWWSRDTLGQRLMAATEELTASNDNTLVFRLKRPFPLLPDSLGRIGGYMPAIMPERLASMDPGVQIKEMVGSGPFRFLADEWVAGSRAAYQKFDGYVPRDEPGSFVAGGKRALVDRVEWHITPDVATASAALLAGEVHIWERMNNDFVPVLEAAPDVQPIAFRVPDVWNLRVNHLQPPFNNLAVRRALLPAVDQKRFMNAMAGSNPSDYMVDFGFFNPASPMSNKAGMDVMSNDMEAARKALAASGYDGTPVTLLDPVDLPYVHAGILVATEMLQQIGFKVDVVSSDWGTLTQRRANKGSVSEGGWNMMILADSGFNGFDPSTTRSLRGNGEKAFFGWPTSEKLEMLGEEWLYTADRQKQVQLCEKIQLEAFDIVPHVPLGASVIYHGVSDRVSNFSRFYTLFYNVELA